MNTNVANALKILLRRTPGLLDEVGALEQELVSRCPELGDRLYVDLILVAVRSGVAQFIRTNPGTAMLLLKGKAQTDLIKQGLSPEQATWVVETLLDALDKGVNIVSAQAPESVYSHGLQEVNQHPMGGPGPSILRRYLWVWIGAFLLLLISLGLFMRPKLQAGLSSQGLKAGDVPSPPPPLVEAQELLWDFTKPRGAAHETKLPRDVTAAIVAAIRVRSGLLDAGVRLNNPIEGSFTDPGQREYFVEVDQDNPARSRVEGFADHYFVLFHHGKPEIFPAEGFPISYSDTPLRSVRWFAQYHDDLLVEVDRWVEANGAVGLWEGKAQILRYNGLGFQVTEELGVVECPEFNAYNARTTNWASKIYIQRGEGGPCFVVKREHFSLPVTASSKPVETYNDDLHALFKSKGIPILK